MQRSNSKARLKKNIEKCRVYKKRLVSAVKILKLELASSRVTKSEYDQKLSMLLENKPLSYWNEYYDKLIHEYNSQIKSIKKRFSYSLITIVLLALAVFGLINVNQFTGQLVYTGSIQHGYIDRGGACAYAPLGLLADTQIDDSTYYQQGPFNAAYSQFNWNTQDIIYLDVGPITDTRSLINSLSLTWNGRFAKTTGSGKPPSNMAIAWYNWNTGIWQQFDQGIVSQAEKTALISTTNLSLIQSMISAENNGYFRIGFIGIGTTSSCNGLILTDYISLDVVQATTTTSSSTTTSSTTITTTSTSSTVISTSSSTSSTSLTTSSSTTTILVSPPGQVIVNVEATLGIIVDAVYSTADFGNMVVGTSDNTLDNIPLPLLIRNEGSVPADVQVEANDLWTSLNKLPSDYQFAISNPDPSALVLTETGLAADSCVAPACFNAAGSLTVPTNMPITPAIPANAIDNLEFADGNDEAEMDIFITVPNDEPAGSKASTITITGVDASTF